MVRVIISTVVPRGTLVIDPLKVVMEKARKLNLAPHQMSLSQNHPSLSHKRLSYKQIKVKKKKKRHEREKKET